MALDMRVDQAWATVRGRTKPEIVTPGFAVSIRDKKPDQKEMAGRPYLGGSYAGFVSRVLAFSIDIFVLTIAVVVGWVFLSALVSMSTWAAWSSPSSTPTAMPCCASPRRASCSP